MTLEPRSGEHPLDLEPLLTPPTGAPQMTPGPREVLPPPPPRPAPSLARPLQLFAGGVAVALFAVLVADTTWPLVVAAGVVSLLFLGVALAVAGYSWRQAAERAIETAKRWLSRK